MRLVTKPVSRTMRKWWEMVDLLSSSPASCMTWVHKDSPDLKTTRSTPRGALQVYAEPQDVLAPFPSSLLAGPGAG
jgi:hypothetical protein